MHMQHNLSAIYNQYCPLSSISSVTW